MILFIWNFRTAKFDIFCKDLIPPIRLPYSFLCYVFWSFSSPLTIGCMVAIAAHFTHVPILIRLMHLSTNANGMMRKRFVVNCKCVIKLHAARECIGFYSDASGLFCSRNLGGWDARDISSVTRLRLNTVYFLGLLLFPRIIHLLSFIKYYTPRSFEI